MGDDKGLVERVFQEMLKDHDEGCLRAESDYLRGETLPEVAREDVRALYSVLEQSRTLPFAQRSEDTSDLEATTAVTREVAIPAARSMVIGGFPIERELGRGGMGIVYLARDPALGRQVALKVLPESFAATHAARERFRREAEAASRLNHPNLCGVLAVGEDRGLPWIAMRYVAGETLSAVLSRAKSATRLEGSSVLGGGWQAAVQLVLALSRAMHVAHEAGIVHRDLKPGNIMIGEDGAPVILDFGLAQDFGSEGPALTQSGDVLGTPYYMAPEQIRGASHRADRTLDVWALGVILYELLTATRPFDAATRDGLYLRILEGEPESIRRYDRRLPKDLEVVVSTALNKDPKRRYATAQDLADDLLSVLSILPIRARPPSVLERTTKFVRRRPALALLFVLFLLGGPLVAVMATKGRLNRERIDGSIASELTEAREAIERREPKRARDLLSKAASLGAPSTTLGPYLDQCEALEAFERMETLALGRDVDPEGESALKELDAWVSRYGPTERTEALRSSLVFRGLGKEAMLEGLAGRDGPVAVALRRMVGGGSPTLDSDDPDVALAIALHLSAKGEHRQALAKLQDLLEKEPHSHSFAWAAAEEATSMQQFVAALAYAGRARVLASGFGPRRESRYAVHLMRAGRTDHAIAVAKAAVAETPDDPVVLLAYANALSEAKDESAIPLYAEILEMAPRLREGWRGYGALLYEKGRFQEAESAFRKSIELKPDPEGWLNLANAQIELKNYPTSEASVREALALRKDFPFAWNTLATNLRFQGRLPEARDAAVAAVTFDPLYGEAHGNLGSILHRMGETAGAERAYQKALELCGDDVRVCFNYALLLHNSNPGLAETYYRKVLATRTEDAQALCNLAGLLSDRGEHEESVRLAQNACDLGPSDPLNWNNLATSLVAAQKIDEAVTALRKALALNPRMIEPHANLMLLLAESDPLVALAHALELVHVEPKFEKKAEGNLLLLLPRVREEESNHVFAEVLRLQHRGSPAPREVEALLLAWEALPKGEPASAQHILKLASGRVLHTLANETGCEGTGALMEYLNATSEGS